ncbi:hypothetical protein IGI04_038990 [Brassica rapa subsp. trilocularis]|uniref:TraB family protein n=1 Tax=Brassica rapa subsp. trilocularis TaxID=1813537 RepID=A0ABQ7LPI9_BRACM|nr:hypothetical protein IGI04_038990 [Brassica rapa subsp. trilocularis]
MEPTQSPSESEPEVHSGEDFVHIEEHSKPAGDFSLSDSIVNVEKEDAVEEEEEEEEHKEDSDSVASVGGDDGEGECSSGKVELPEELAKSVVILTCESNGESGSCDVYLIGTAHVSKESCREVKEIISFLKPEAVFVELCSSRVSILQPQSLKIPTMSDMIESWKQKQNTFGILYGWFLAKASFLNLQLEVFPGTEFRVAYEEALKYGGSVILGDRPVQLKEMDNVDMVTLVIQEMSKEFPSLMETLVHERDQYMASSLLRVASEHNSVVAVIGRGHINGIKKNWKQPITMKDLMEIPSDNSVFTVKRIVSSVAIAVAGTAIFTGILLSRRRLLGITSLTSTSSMSMEPTQSPPSETEVHSSEDFVHGEEDSKPTGDMSSSESIVNVEKEDLLDDDAVVEEAHDDSDSVVSGGDAPAAGDDGDGECSPEVLELLEELVKSGAMLTCDSTAETGSCYVLLIGTSHVSEESCRVVKAVISYLKPEAVLVELCSSRVSLLQPQTLKIASEFGVFPGSEFRVAYEEACKYGGKVMLVDRPIQITLKRTWAKMPLWHKVKFVYTLMFQDVFLPSSEEHGKRPQEMETADSMTLLIEELSKEFPSLIETLVYERDRYMATALLDIASGCNLVVAVIGYGHINGIKKNWKQPVSIEDLMEIPGDGSVFTVKRIVSSVAIAVAGTAIFTGILLARRR